MKRLVLIILILYLSFGFLFSLYSYSYDLRTFVCSDQTSPHGYITLGTETFANPDPKRCSRRGFELKSIATIPFFTVAGPVILAGRRG